MNEESLAAIANLGPIPLKRRSRNRGGSMKMENHFSQIAIIFVMLAATTTTMTGIAHASIIGDFGIGYQDGKNQAYNDWYQGNGEDSSCPRSGEGDSLSYCSGYAIGYNGEWGAFLQTQR